MNRIKNRLWAIPFGLVRNLPSSTFRPFPYGLHLRRFLARRILDHCGSDVNIERGCHFGSGYHIQIGDRSAIGIRAEIFAGVTIGNDVMMGPDVVILTFSHRFDDLARPMHAQGFEDIKPVVIDDDVWIGQRAFILPGVHIGRGSIIGACAVVTKDVPPYSIAAGNPARIVRSRLPAEAPPVKPSD